MAIGRLDYYLSIQESFLHERYKEWEATWYDTEQACVEKSVIPLGKHAVLI